MSRIRDGVIVIVDWREGALPSEPTKRRPAIVVEDTDAFADEYPNIIVVPLTTDANLAHAVFAERIAPTKENGATAPSRALGHHITSVSLRCVRATPSHITKAQLTAVRAQVAAAIGATRQPGA